MNTNLIQRFRDGFFVLLVSLAVVSPTAHAEEAPATGFGQQAIQIARGYPDGGGYVWKGSTGVCETLTFNGKTLLEKQPVGTYCCGFTLQAAFKLAQNNNLFDGKTYDQVKQFQIEWYGSTEETAEQQCTLAMQHLGVGHAVNHDDARPGDFGNFWRTKSGHSVLFLNWVTDDDGNRIGIHYRSSQSKTDGIGDRTEYFKGHGGEVDPSRLYLCRFNESKAPADTDADDNEDPEGTTPKPRPGANR